MSHALLPVPADLVGMIVKRLSVLGESNIIILMFNSGLKFGEEAACTVHEIFKGSQVSLKHDSKGNPPCTAWMETSLSTLYIGQLVNVST